MNVGRVFTAGVASLAVAGCAAVALGMSSAAKHDPPLAAPRDSAAARLAARPAVLPMHVAARVRMSTAVSPSPSRTEPASSTAARSLAPSSSSSSSSSPSPSIAVRSVAPHVSSSAAAPRSAASPRPAVTSASTPRGQALPLRFSTGSATRVITVAAHAAGSTTAALQAWTKVAAGGWRKYGSAITAHVGADGLSRTPSESRSATPVGSFTLTQAFGRDTDPGTALPYIHTRPSDWWISQAGRLYNTHQRCSSSCAFRLGSPNEHLYYETPFYNYAVVIDYNTRNAPGGVRQGAGSAFFLHVTDGNPTAGCVAIPQSKLVPLLRWLTPTAHPRILIGVH